MGGPCKVLTDLNFGQAVEKWDFRAAQRSHTPLNGAYPDLSRAEGRHGCWHSGPDKLTWMSGVTTAAAAGGGRYGGGLRISRGLDAIQ